MKAGWQLKRLGDVCQFIGGSQPPKAVFTKTEKAEYVRLIQIRDYKGDNHIVFIPRAQARRFCTKTDIMIGRYGPPVFQILRGLEGAYNVALMKAVPDETKLSRDFLFYFLNSPKVQNHVIISSDRAAGQCGLNKETIEPYPILVPPLSDQQRIVAILDEAFDGIATTKANAEKNLKNARELFESHLQSVFTQGEEEWDKKSLSETCAISSALVDPREDKYLDMLHVGGANIESKSGALLDLKTAREEGLISGKFVFDETMVLYSKIRPYLMKVARPSFNGLCSADIYPLSVKVGQLNRDYLFHMLLSPAFTEYANIGSARAGMPKVNRDHLFAFRFYLPPIEKQKGFAEKLDALHEETQRLTSLYQQKLAALDELKKSLLHKAFSGDL